MKYKAFFIDFEGLSFGEKIKVVDTSFKSMGNFMEFCKLFCTFFIVNFEHISHIFLMFLLLNLNKYMLAGIRAL